MSGLADRSVRLSYSEYMLEKEAREKAEAASQGSEGGLEDLCEGSKPLSAAEAASILQRASLILEGEENPDSEDEGAPVPKDFGEGLDEEIAREEPRGDGTPADSSGIATPSFTAEEAAAILKRAEAIAPQKKKEVKEDPPSLKRGSSWWGRRSKS